MPQFQTPSPDICLPSVLEIPAVYTTTR